MEIQSTKNYIHISSIWKIFKEVALGIPITLQYTIIAVCLGFIIATLLTICKISRHKLLKLLADIYLSIFRGTPLMIQLYIIYFSIPYLMNTNMNVFTAGIIAFSLNSAAYVSEIIRSGIISIDKSQIEAAQVLGIPHFYIMKDIILPQALRKILPSLVNEVINLIKESATISVLGEMDLMRRAHILSFSSYNFFTPMISAAFCYYTLVLVFSILAQILEKKLKY